MAEDNVTIQVKLDKDNREVEQFLCENLRLQNEKLRLEIKLLERQNNNEYNNNNWH